MLYEDSAEMVEYIQQALKQAAHKNSTHMSPLIFNSMTDKIKTYYGVVDASEILAKIKKRRTRRIR
jgi:hypothetical protein